MSSAPPTAKSLPAVADQGKRPRALRAETLAEGILLVLGFTVLQRLVGFFRGILFCRWMSPEELGYWDLSFNFLMLAAPLVVLGIPGTFGRYVEHYRQAGQLTSFLRRTTLASLALTVVCCLTIFLGRSGISWLLFGDTTHETLALVLALGLLAVIGFNFLISVFAGLRQMRIVSRMQFAHSLLFAAVGLVLLSTWRPTAASVVVAFSVACLITSCFMLPFVLRRARGSVGIEECPLSQRSLWSKLLPFAAWVWATDVLANVFSMADRYMIIHFGGFDSEVAAGLVGNYHSSRVVPLLMVGVCGLLSDVALPHLSHDWEARRRQRVSDRINLMLKSLSIILTAGGITILAASPLIFDWMLGGKYHGGLSILPWATIGCIWYSLCMIAQNYLWCAERARLVSLMYAVGLALNIGLNLILLPILGLSGAVLATALAMAVSLALLFLLNRRGGMDVQQGTYLLAVLPISLCGGPWIAGLAMIAVVVVAIRTSWLFSAEEKSELSQTIRRYLRKFRKVGS
ncbi:MAG: lipopolysaccharide biosynthesis protein [Pirellulales bacterium]|nr:lipopolysaccharide biosynthesis protein [Pirellulales bacterium]